MTFVSFREDACYFWFKVLKGFERFSRCKRLKFSWAKEGNSGNLQNAQMSAKCAQIMPQSGLDTRGIHVRFLSVCSAFCSNEHSLKSVAKETSGYLRMIPPSNTRWQRNDWLSNHSKLPNNRRMAGRTAEFHRPNATARRNAERSACPSLLSPQMRSHMVSPENGLIDSWS